MSPARKRQLAGASALALAALALGFLAYGGIEDNLVYYWSPEELLANRAKAQQATVRLGGIVREGSFQFDPKTLDLRFDVAMESGESSAVVPVKATNTPPQMFREGIGVVVEGQYDGALFQADRLMVKHSNEYRAPEDGEKPAADTLLE